MDKTSFIEVENVLDDNKMCYRFLKETNTTDIEMYSRNVERQFIAILNEYNVDVNSHIEKLTYHLEGGEGNKRIIVLDLYLRNGKESKKHLRDRIGFLKLLESTPRTKVYLDTDTNRYYFTLYNITDNIPENYVGLFIFSITIEDEQGLFLYIHKLLKFSKVHANNSEVIEDAKKEGALHFFYYQTEIEHEMDRIIEDFKNSIPYTLQLGVSTDL